MDFGHLIRALSDGFGNPAFIGSVCSLLVASAVAVAFFAWRASSRLRKDADLVLRKLRDEANSSEALTHLLLDLPPSPLSQRLQDDTLLVRELDGRYYRVTPSSHDQYDAIIHKYLDTRSLEAAPNIFVGVGLLLTFVGLSLSLWNASQGAASGNIAVVKQSVTTLLEFSAVKFTTSLVALFCSIGLGIWIRYQRRSVERRAADINDTLNSRLPRLTLEIIELYRLSPAYQAARDDARSQAMLAALFQAPATLRLSQTLEELTEEAKEQTQQLTAFNSDLAIQLSGVLDSKLQPMLAGLADRLESALRDMGGSLGQSNEDALKTLLESFVGDLRSASSNDSANVQQNLQRLAGDLSKASSDLADRMAGVFTGMEATGDRFAAVLGEASTMFRGDIGRVQADIGTSLTDAMTALADAANRSSRESETLVDKLAAGASVFRDTVEQGGTTFAGELDRGVRSIDVIVERLGQSVSQLGAIVDRTAVFAQTSSERTGERIGQLNDTLTHIDSSFQRVNQASETFTGAAAHVRGAVDLLRVTQSAVQDKAAALQRAAESIASSSDSLAGTLGRDILRMTEGLSTTTDRLTLAITAVAKESESAGTRLTGAISTTLAEYERRFARIDGELQQALTVIIETFTTTYEDIRERVNVVDREFASSINKLVAFNERFEEHAEELTEAIAELPKALSAR